MSDKLTAKQQKFADSYIIMMNGTNAARLAGYTGDDATLAVTASRLLRNDKVLAYIDGQLRAYTMSANEVLIHLTDIARGDIAFALNSIGGIDPSEAVRVGKSHLIKRVKTKTTIISGRGEDETEIHETEIEMYDRLKALELLAKYHDLVNRVKVEDWRSEIVGLLKEGKVTPDQVKQELGYELAQELFNAVGISVLTEREDGEA